MLRLSHAACAAVLLLALSFVVLGEESRPLTVPELAWTPIFEGIEMARATLEVPVPMAVVSLRIDLEAEGLRFFVTPQNGDAPGETDSRIPSAFLEEFGCQVAVNASPFSPVTSIQGQPQDVLGLSVSDGDAYSTPHGDWGALVIDKENRVRCIRQTESAADAHNAVGGFELIVEGGAVIGPQDVRHPRTGVGVSEDGRRLYVVVIDGRQANYSLGATQAELAEWLRQLGAYSAVNLDGGGSTTLVLDDGQGGAKVVNRPIHAGISGRERPSANHLGIYARPVSSGALSPAQR